MIRLSGIVLVLVLASCSLDYGDSELATEISEDIPDTILTGVTHTVVRDNVIRFRITADRIEAFAEENREYLFGVGFTEYDSNGEIRTEGTSETADFQTDTENVELSGDLRFYSYPDEAWIETDYLYWNSDDRRLTSKPEDPVSLERNDGTSVVGRGFSAEMDESLIIFSDGVSGTIVDSE